MNYRSCCLLLATVVFLNQHNVTDAGIIVPSFGLSARAEVVAAGLGDSDFDNSNVPAVADKVFSNGGVSGEAHAIANYGSLQASSSLTKGAAIEPFNFGTGEAIFSDILTINGGVGAGTISMNFLNTGSLTLSSASSSATARTELNIFFTDGSFQSDNRVYEVAAGNSSATINDLFTTTSFNFTFGVPFSFDVRLSAEVSLEETDSGTVTNDFYNTSVLQLLEVNGATGPVTVSAESGTNYTILNLLVCARLY